MARNYNRQTQDQMRATTSSDPNDLSGAAPRSKRIRRRRLRLITVVSAVICLLNLTPIIEAASTPMRKPDDNPSPVVVAASMASSPAVRSPQEDAANVPAANVPAAKLSSEDNNPSKPDGDKPVLVVSPAVRTPQAPHSVLVDSEFPEWCAEAGIQTNLTVQSFEYPDYLKIHMHQAIMGDDDDDDDETSQQQQVPNFTTLQVRGLAAERDIKAGEVVIRIPFSAMFSVPTTIDADPILGNVMGPAARDSHDWDDEYFELPLLTIALLYHRKLGKASPLYHYIMVLQTSSTESIPFLWNKQKLRQQATEGIRRYSRGIYRDVRDIYAQVVPPLRQEFPELFAQSDTYSFPNFIWAFSIINSRHWHLPIPSSVDVLRKQRDKEKRREDQQENAPSSPAMGDQLPPASLPTDEWVQEQGTNDGDDALLPETDTHSFLAPVADLLNFGPPCTRGEYNTATNAFELIATCSFTKGQEITYFYSDDCDDIVIANYGFTHPIVPKCPGVEVWQEEMERWKRRARRLETELSNAYDELDQMERDLELTQVQLRDCGCDEYANTMAPSASSKTRKPIDDAEHDHIRGSSAGNGNNNSERGYNGIRKAGSNHQMSQTDDLL